MLVIDIDWGSLMYGITLGCIPTVFLMVGATAWDEISEKRRKNNER